MKYEWKDLPERKNYFTVKNTAMINLNTGKVVRQYCTNTKIAVVQKCVTPTKTYYRTQDAEHNYLNYAFEAEAFGLPNEKAPSAPSKLSSNKLKSAISHIKPGSKKQTSSGNKAKPKGGGATLKKIFNKLLRRKNG